MKPNLILANKAKSYKFLYLVLSFFGDFNNYLITLIFILFGVKIDLSPIQIGWIVSSYGIVYFISSPLTGFLGEKISYKVSLLIATLGQTLLAILYLLVFYFKENNNNYLVILIIGQIFRAIFYSFYWSSIEAFLSDTAGQNIKQHQENISHFCISWSLGAATGSILGGFLVKYNLLLGFFIILLVYIIGLLIVIFRIKNNKPKNSARMKSELKEIQTNLKLIQKRFLWIFLCGTLMFTISSHGIMNYFPNYASLKAGLDLREPQVGILVFTFGFSRFMAFVLQEKIPINRKWLILSIFLTSFFIILYPLFNNFFILSLILSLSGFFTGRIYYNALELTLKYESNRKNTNAGYFESIVGLGTGITPIFSGILAKMNLRFPFYVFGILGIFLSLITLLLNRNPDVNDHSDKYEFLEL